MTSRFKLFLYVLIYGLLVAFSLPSTALAASHKHKHGNVEHRHKADVSARNVNRRSSKRISAAQRRRELVTENKSRHEHAVSHHVRHKSALVLTKGKAWHLLHERRAEINAARRDIRIARSLHAHLSEEAKQLTRRQKLLRAEAYRAHIARFLADHRIRLAEMRGTLNSKSIRSWRDYVLSVPIRLISVDLNDPSVKVSALLARDGIGSAESFSKMIRRSQPDVAVTGTFFSLDNLRPVGDIVINGDLAYFGGMGTALCITRDNLAEMVTVPWGHHHDWSNYEFVMACGPRLLEDHEIVLDPKSERFKDRHMLAPNSRIGVGITATNKLIFVMTKKPIYLGRLAKIMRTLGCSQAMNLDAGTSTGFYYEGDMMARPGRWLTNAIVVYANQHRT
jgi:hypothetical protein